MTRTRLTRLPPAGARIAPLGAWRALRTPGAQEELSKLLTEWSEGAPVAITASGREALRIAFVEAARRSGRDEVVIPSYTCFSVAAAAVAAGCHVRLVDIDEHGRIDCDRLGRLPLDRAAAVVVCNLFGLGEPIEAVAKMAADAGAMVIDDAAQSAGATTPSGDVGRRGHPAVLSFGRGKPMGGLGGGALVGLDIESPAPPPARGSFGSWMRVLAWDAALAGTPFRMLAAIPPLRIGETPFEPGFTRGGLGPELAALAAIGLGGFDEAAARRRSVALHLAGQVKVAPGWTPLVARDGERGVYPRLAVIAPRAEARKEALAPLGRLGAGASPLYPSALDEIDALAPHRVGDDPMPVGRELATRILTLPTHGRLRGSRLDEAIGILARVSTTTAEPVTP